MLIYKITEVSTGKCYIGLTTRPTPTKRYAEHFSNARRGAKGSKLYEGIRAAGLDKNKFSFEILEDHINSMDELFERERHYIELFDSTDGFNTVRGGIDTVHREAVSHGVLAHWASLNDTEKEYRMEGLKSFISENKEAYRSRAKVLCENRKIPVRVIHGDSIIEFESLYRTNGLKDFCDDNTLNFYEMVDMAKGRLVNGFNGYLCYFVDETGSSVLPPHTNRKKWQKTSYNRIQYTSYQMVNPEGVTITITNIKKFCKDNGLCITNMYNVMSGKAKSHKGWKKYVKQEI